MTISDLVNITKFSKVTLIGHTSQREKYADRFLNLFPNLKMVSSKDFFNLEDYTKNTICCDLTLEFSDHKSFTKSIRAILNDSHSMIGNFMVKTHIYMGPQSNTTHHFGSNALLYQSVLAVSFMDNGISIIKNRNGEYGDFTYDELKKSNRDQLIESIFSS